MAAMGRLENHRDHGCSTLAAHDFRRGYTRRCSV